MRISDWSSDVCSSDLGTLRLRQQRGLALRPGISDISPMASFARSPLTAVLGPPNTGKTYLAVERMFAHSRGLLGLSLRLLAREVRSGERRVGEECVSGGRTRWSPSSKRTRKTGVL